MTRRDWFIGWVALLLLAPTTHVSRTAHADAPACRYTIKNGTVYDARTKLTWQQDGSDSGTVTQPEAVSYCAALPLAGGGWRVPTVSELRTLVDPTRFDAQFAIAAIDATAFPNTQPDNFWTSTPVANTSGNIWFVDFNGGGVSYGSTVILPLVRCVR